MGAGHEELTTSADGRAFLERQEGVVLKAYRDVAGVWTIGAGLTAASGVVRPKAGMVITRAEADRLLAAALAARYEPAVRKALPGARPCEFDAGVSFHWNTGAVAKATWVEAWLGRDWPAVHVGLLKWVQGGGKVLPALQRRREEEFRLMREGRYEATAPAHVERGDAARIVIGLSQVELAEVRAGFRTLGYEPGLDIHCLDAEMVRRFQRDHGLMVDGVIGRATLSTLQRRLDARGHIVPPAAAGLGGSVAALTAPQPDAAASWLGWLALGIAAFALCRLAWLYRDVLAAKIAPLAPKLAARLRSI